MASLNYHYETIGRILQHLVGQGLRRVDLEGADAMEIMTHRIGDEKEVLATFNDVLHWMLGEGLIRSGTVQAVDNCDIFNDVQLTSKGLAVLQEKPSDEDLGESVEETLARADGELSIDMYTKIGAFVGGTAGGLLRVAGG